MAGSKPWEQNEVTHDIPVYDIYMPISENEAVLQARGDQHLGLKTLDIDLMKTVYKREQDKYRNRLFVLDTGDWLENATKKSIGHNYDIGIPDPAKQMKLAKEIQDELDEHLYGSKLFKSMKKCTRKTTKHARRIGIIGNHEYRSRKESGIWLNKELYSGKGVIDGGIHCLVNLTIHNKKLKKKRTFIVYVSHRLTNSAAAISHSTILRNFKKKKADIDADIYVCGHYHTSYTDKDIKFMANGKRKKVIYVVNPAPCKLTEYAEWAQYSPNENGHYTNIYLPLNENKNAYGYV